MYEYLSIGYYHSLMPENLADAEMALGHVLVILLLTPHTFICDWQLNHSINPMVIIKSLPVNGAPDVCC